MERNRRNQCNTRNKSSLAKNGTENSANTDDYLLYKDPYEVIYNPPDIYMPCSRLDHVCNKPTNCSINPWCVYGLGEGKDGLWELDNYKCLNALYKARKELNEQNEVLDLLINNYHTLESLRRVLKPCMDSNGVVVNLKNEVDLVNELDSTGNEGEFDKLLLDSSTLTEERSQNSKPLCLSPPIGLSNLGATCYLNVLLQCLYHNPYIRQAIYNIDIEMNSDLHSESEMKVDVVEEDRMSQMNKIVMCLQNIFAFMQYYYCSVYTVPDSDAKDAGGDIKMFTSLLGLNTCQQQDPQEFHKLFLEQLDKMNRPTQKHNETLDSEDIREDVPMTVSSLITGYECQTIKCLNCMRVSEKRTIFHELDCYLNAPVVRLDETEDTDKDPVTRVPEHPPPPLSLQDILLNNYSTSERLTGDNKYDCKHCSGEVEPPRINDPKLTHDVYRNNKQEALKSTKILTYPSVLFVPLMRYMYDFESGVKKKLQTEVSYPGEMELNGDCYELVAVLYHIGQSSYSGHYVTEVLEWSSGDWWLCDDTEVKKSVTPVSTIDTYLAARNCAWEVKRSKTQKKAKPANVIEEINDVSVDNKSSILVNNAETETAERDVVVLDDSVDDPSLEVEVVSGQEKKRRGGRMAKRSCLEECGRPTQTGHPISTPLKQTSILKTMPKRTPKQDSSVPEASGKQKRSVAKWPDNINRLSDVYLVCYVKRDLITRYRDALRDDNEVSTNGNNAGIRSMGCRIPRFNMLRVCHCNSSLYQSCIRFRKHFERFKSEVQSRRRAYRMLLDQDNQNVHGAQKPTSKKKRIDTAEELENVLDLHTDVSTATADMENCLFQPKYSIENIQMNTGAKDAKGGTLVELVIHDPSFVMVPSIWLKAWITGVAPCDTVAATASSISSSKTKEVIEIEGDESSSGYCASMDKLNKGPKAWDESDCSPFLYSEPYNIAPYMCEHGSGISPNELCKFKIISKDAHDFICSTLVELPPVVVLVSNNWGHAELRSGVSKASGLAIATVSSALVGECSSLHKKSACKQHFVHYACSACYDTIIEQRCEFLNQTTSYRSCLDAVLMDEEAFSYNVIMDNVQYHRKSMKTEEQPDAILNNEQALFWISKTWVTKLKKECEASEKKQTLDGGIGTPSHVYNSSKSARKSKKNSNDVMMCVDSDLTGNARVSVQADTGFREEDANAAITCMHGLLVLQYKKKSRLISKSTWDLIKEAFPQSTAHPFVSLPTRRSGEAKSGVDTETARYCALCRDLNEQAADAKSDFRHFQAIQRDEYIPLCSHQSISPVNAATSIRRESVCLEQDSVMSMEGVEHVIPVDAVADGCPVLETRNCLYELNKRFENDNTVIEGNEHACELSRLPPSLRELVTSMRNGKLMESQFLNGKNTCNYYVVEHTWLQQWRHFLEPLPHTVLNSASDLWFLKPTALDNQSLQSVMECGCRYVPVDSPHSDSTSMSNNAQRNPETYSNIMDADQGFVVPYWLKDIADLFYQAHTKINCSDMCDGTSKTYSRLKLIDIDKCDQLRNDELMVVDESGVEREPDKLKLPLKQSMTLPDIEVLDEEQWFRLSELYPAESCPNAIFVAKFSVSKWLEHDRNSDDMDRTRNLVEGSGPLGSPGCSYIWKWEIDNHLMCTACMKERHELQFQKSIHYKQKLFHVHILAATSSFGRDGGQPDGMKEANELNTQEGSNANNKNTTRSSGRRTSNRRKKQDEVQIHVDDVDTVGTIKLKIYEQLKGEVVDAIVNPLQQEWLYTENGVKLENSQEEIRNCIPHTVNKLFVRLIVRENFQEMVLGMKKSKLKNKRRKGSEKRKCIELDSQSETDSDIAEKSKVDIASTQFTEDEIDEYFNDFVCQYQDSFGSGGVETGFNGSFLRGSTAIGIENRTVTNENDDHITIIDCDDETTLANPSTKTNIHANPISSSNVSGKLDLFDESKEESGQKDSSEGSGDHVNTSLQLLLSMGFSEKDSRDALASSDNNVELSISMLTSV